MTGVHLLYEAADHHFRCVEVCDNAVTERAYGFDSGVCLLMHELGFLAKCDAFSGLVVNGDDRRLVQGDLVVLEDDGIGRPEVHCQLLRKKVECHILRVKGLF